MTTTKLKIFDIETIIPKKNYSKSQTELKNKYTEWCVTKYNIDNKSYITISVQIPNNKIMYFDTSGEQIIYDLDNSYDEFIINKTFWYAIT